MMDTETVILKCVEFLTNFGTHKTKAAPQKYAKYFEQFRNLNSLWNSKNINDQDSLKLSETWNSVLNCYKVVLEKISAQVTKSEKALEWENNWANFNEKTQKKHNSRSNGSYPAELRVDSQFLNDFLDLIKELTSVCENMKSSLENNIGLTSGSSTNTLSIVLLLVNIICHKIETNNHDFLNKIYGSTLYCLNILFRIYKIEFTESWNLILFPEKIQVSSPEDISTLFNHSSISLNTDSDIPFLIYFLFSSSTKVRVNSILCIQSIFAAPIFRFNSMTSLLCKPFSQQIMDTSASSLSKNAVILTFSLLKFGEMIFKSENYDLDTGITLIKAISKVVNTTPLSFWTSNLIHYNTSFADIISDILLSGLKDLNLNIPSLQLFSNILNLMKNCEIPKSKLFDNLFPSFEQVIINSDIVLSQLRGCSNENVNGKGLSARFSVILSEVLNFYIRLLENFPFSLTIINFKQNLLEENKSRTKHCLLTFLDIIELINFHPDELDSLIYEKSLRITYLFVDYIRKMDLKRNDIESQFYSFDSEYFFQNIKKSETTMKDIKETHFKIVKLLKSFILLTFDSVLESLMAVKEFKYAPINFKANKNSICRILDIYSTINPMILEDSFSKRMKVNDSSDTEIKLCKLHKDERIHKYFIESPKVNFIELLLLLLENTEDKILPSLINLLLCYCSSSEWLKYSSFTTFQHFESTLVQKLLLLIDFEKSNVTKPNKEHTALSVNKAMIHISTYHYVNINNVIVCSPVYRRNNLNLLEEDYNNFVQGLEIEFNDICCLLNWKDIFLKYKSLIQCFELNLASVKALTLLNFSETIRAFGRILRLIPFSLDDLGEIIWTLDLLGNLISKTSSSSLRLNKVKWNSIYALGLLFENDHFYNIVIQSFDIKEKMHLCLTNSFATSWKALCTIIKNNSELIKVRINALRSLIAYSEKIGSGHGGKIPFALLLETWEAFKYAVNTKVNDVFTLPDNSRTSNHEYSSIWNVCLNKLGSILYDNSIFYMKNPPDHFTNLETDRVSKYCFELLGLDI